jgi:hypothetical protein
MKKYDKILLSIYEKMYQESDPPADIHEIISSGEGRIHGWFWKYYLPQERQNEIMEEILKEAKLKKWEKKSMRITVLLGCSPSSTNWEFFYEKKMTNDTYLQRAENEEEVLLALEEARKNEELESFYKITKKEGKLIKELIFEK